MPVKKRALLALQPRLTRHRSRGAMRHLEGTTAHVTLLGAGLLGMLLPTATYACAVCGGAEDNGYFWGVLFLMSMPFAIGSFVGGWLLYNYRRASAAPASSTPTPTIEGPTPPPAMQSSASERHEVHTH
jgi:hypothetical protein